MEAMLRHPFGSLEILMQNIDRSIDVRVHGGTTRIAHIEVLMDTGAFVPTGYRYCIA